MNKPFLVFGMQRTGTTLLMQIIKNYEPKPRLARISEYFGPQYTIIDNNITLKGNSPNSWGRPAILNKPDIPNQLSNNEIIERIEKLEKYKDQKILIKILSSQITDTIFDYVKNRYLIILIERREKYDQLLSFLIAKQDDIWNAPITALLKPTPRFSANLKLIDEFFEAQLLYQKWKEEFLRTSAIDVTIVYYEDLIAKNNYKTVIEKIGINYDNRNIIGLPKKLHSLEEKKKIIINIEEVKNYYDHKECL
jgi:LPS sulfotransferase NodH